MIMKWIMKNRKNLAEQYFSQKEWSLLETVLLAVLIIAAIVATFVQGGGPVGIPFFMISAVGLIFCRSAKIKDSEIDRMLQNLLVDNGVERTNNSFSGYELSNTVVKKRKDGKWISSKYYITNISWLPDKKIALDVYSVDLVSAVVNKEIYTISSDELVLVKKRIRVSEGQKSVAYLRLKSSNQLLPITLDDYTTSQLIEQICSEYEEI